MARSPANFWCPPPKIVSSRLQRRLLLDDTVVCSSADSKKSDIAFARVITADLQKMPRAENGGGTAFANFCVKKTTHRFIHLPATDV